MSESKNKLPTHNPHRKVLLAGVIASALSAAPVAAKEIQALGGNPVIRAGTTENWSLEQENVMRESIETTLREWRSADGKSHLTATQVAEVMRAVNPVIGTIDDVGRTGKPVTQEGAVIGKTIIADGPAFMNNGSNSPERVTLRLREDHKPGVRVTVTLTDGTVVEFVVANKCANTIVVTPPRKPTPVPAPSRSEVCVPPTEWRAEMRQSNDGITINGRKLHNFMAVWIPKTISGFGEIDLGMLIENEVQKLGVSLPDRYLVYVDHDCNGIPEAIYCIYKKDGTWHRSSTPLKVTINGRERKFSDLSVEEKEIWFKTK